MKEILFNGTINGAHFALLGALMVAPSIIKGCISDFKENRENGHRW